MSDGQTFYAVLVLLYLSSCIKWAAPGSIGARTGLFGAWKLQRPLATLGGIRKSIFFLSLLPWPSALVVAEPSHSQNVARRGGLLSSLRLIRLVQRASSDLRMLSLGVFVTFFVLIPYVYYREAGSVRTFYTIGIGFTWMLMAGLRFVGLHRRLVPDDPAERYKQLFLTMTMPWHAMRLSDELLLQARFSIHPLALASLVDERRGSPFLAQTLRDSIYLAKPLYAEDEVRAVYYTLGVEADRFLVPPVRDESDAGASNYCPCCHTAYTAGTEVCVDCENTALRMFDR